jgi:Arc/MetJ-type ribon-helix-helix transcriptional regulator
MSEVISSDLGRLIQEKMIAGAYPNEEALLRDALVALDDVQQRREELRAELEARLDDAGKGESKPLDVASFLAEARRRWKVRSQNKSVG